MLGMKYTKQLSKADRNQALVLKMRMDKAPKMNINYINDRKTKGFNNPNQTMMKQPITSHSHSQIQMNPNSSFNVLNMNSFDQSFACQEMIQTNNFQNIYQIENTIANGNSNNNNLPSNTISSSALSSSFVTKKIDNLDHDLDTTKKQSIDKNKKYSKNTSSILKTKNNDEKGIINESPLSYHTIEKKKGKL